MFTSHINWVLYTADEARTAAQAGDKTAREYCSKYKISW